MPEAAAAAEAAPPADMSADADAAKDNEKADEKEKREAAPMKPMGPHADAMKSSPPQGVRHDKKDKTEDAAKTDEAKYGPGWDEQKCAQAHKDGTLLKKGDCPE